MLFNRKLSEDSENFSFDEVAGGIYTDKAVAGEVSYNFRALFDYCKARSISPSELSEDDLKQFEVQ